MSTHTSRPLHHDRLASRGVALSSLLVGAAALCCTLACSGGSSDGAGPSSGGTASTKDDAWGHGNYGGESSTAEGGAQGVDCDERETTTVKLDQTIWQTGFKVTLGTATLLPSTASCSDGNVSIDVQMENRSSEDSSFDAVTVLRSGDREYKVSYLSDLPVVPGNRQGKGTLLFPVGRDVSLTDAVLSFGDTRRHQAIVPFAAPDEAITLEPMSIPMKSKVIAGHAVFDFEGAFLTADAAWSHSSLAENEVALRLDYSLTNQGAWDTLWASHNDFALELPDGTSIETDSGDTGSIHTSQTTVTDLWVRFIIPAPVAGKYILHLRGDWDGAYNTSLATADYPFELDSVPSFGEK